MPIRIRREETNLEILARIAKATAQKYDCSMTIDFQNGNRRIEFSGDPASKAKIASTLATYFKEAAINETAEKPQVSEGR